uniref:Homolog of methylated-DNA-protein-cysteine methyltransferase protein n=2 Tax=Kitasatospora setae TaxID=2066 RepID=Q6L8H9_9ACTN|nr:homolog of methylated-DNA-protein-cysteine methyltransferase protein [Kitasatospora setae KM-6054]
MTAGRFEELHRRRTGRSAIETTRPFPGLATALRTGRTRHLPLDPAARGDREARVLDAVRGISPGQLRPLSWVAREAGLPDGPGVERLAGVLAANPFTVLVPCHRVTYEDGAPCDAAYRPADGDALRRAEGLDMTEVRAFARSGAVLLGSDTTRIFCYPTCAHARRITAPHRVPFTGPRDADLAGYRACKSCRPVSV